MKIYQCGAQNEQTENNERGVYLGYICTKIDVWRVRYLFQDVMAAYLGDEYASNWYFKLMTV